MRLALRILRPHSLILTFILTLILTLTLTLTLLHSHFHSHSHCLSLSLSLSLSLISLSSLSSLPHLFLISLSPSLSHLSLSISLSISLSLSPLCLSFFRLFSLVGGSGQRATYKGLFTPASKKSAVFFPTSLPSIFLFWSDSFRPPPWP